MTYRYIDFTIEKVILDLELLFVGGCGLFTIFAGLWTYQNVPIEVTIVGGLFGIFAVLCTLIKIIDRDEYFVPYKDLIRCNMFKEFHHYRGMYN